jgi:prophage regulatory protein
VTIEVLRTYIVRATEADKRLGQRKSDRYRKIARGVLPKYVKIGRRDTGLFDHEIEAINWARAAGKSEDELRALVAELIAARSAQPARA